MPLPAWAIAGGISLGGKLLGGLFGGGGKKKMRRGYRQLSNLGEELKAFDPSEYAKEASMAQWDMLQNPLSEALSDYRADQVGRGRLRTGFSFQGEDRMVRDVFQNYTDQLAARSMQAGQMRLGAMGMAGDVYAGIYDQGAREKQSAQNWWGGLGRDIGLAYLMGR
jgi:hypothetical protein